MGTVTAEVKPFLAMRKIDEEEYDVRAVEARLARMEAARRSRAGGSSVQAPAQGQPPVAHAKRHTEKPTVGDFELSEVDSDSDDCGSVSTSSESEDGAATGFKERGMKQKKQRLKDSLDLSMSMSMAWPQETEKKQSKMSSSMRRVEEITVKKPPVEAQTKADPVSNGGTVQMTSGREDVFAGKLIQRRRELERQAIREPEQATQASYHDSRSRQLTSMSETNMMSFANERGPRLELEKPKPPVAEPERVTPRLVKPTENQRDDHPLDKGQQRMPERSLLQPPTRMSMKNHDHSEAAKPIGARANAPPPQVVMPLKPDGRNLRRGSPPVECVRPVAIPPASQAAHQAQTTQRRKETMVKEPIPSNPPAIPQPKKAVAFTVSQTNTSKAPVAGTVTAVAPTDATKQGYSRGNSSSNQQQTVPVAAVVGKKEPQEDPEDLIDDLLTAEELRLRESLDKLSSRLHSLATARETLTKTGKESSNNLPDGRYAGRKQPQPTATNDDEVEFDNVKAPRVGSYGGGANARLGQPASPTTRVSNAKRSELSSGVHKPRVRPGSTLVQDAGVLPLAEAGKHKVVVKKDLAHLLF